MTVTLSNSVLGVVILRAFILRIDPSVAPDTPPVRPVRLSTQVRQIQRSGSPGCRGPSLAAPRAAPTALLAGLLLALDSC